MELIGLKNVVRKDSLIHYINKYNCTVIYNDDCGIICEQEIEIILEKTALGTTNIQLYINNDLLQNNIGLLENFIDEKNKQGLFV